MIPRTPEVMDAAIDLLFETSRQDQAFAIEAHKEIRRLRREVAALKKDLTKMQKAGVTRPFART